MQSETKIDHIDVNFTLVCYPNNFLRRNNEMNKSKMKIQTTVHNTLARKFKFEQYELEGNNDQLL